MHAYKYFDTRVPFIRNMDSQDQFAQRNEESAESERSVGASHAPSEQPLPPEHGNRPREDDQKSRSKNFKEL